MSAGWRVACLIAFAIYVGFALLLVFTVEDGTDTAGSPVGYDFSAYYEAAQFARRGEASQAYDDDAMLAAEKARFPRSTVKLPWSYPPLFQAILLPVAILPYFIALSVWTLLLAAGHAAFTRQLATPATIWPLVVFPGAGINLMLGANGLLVALFVGAGLWLLDRRPRVAGALFALALFKPHLALLVPIALLASGRYRALAAMIASGAAFALVTTLFTGTASWSAFFAKVAHAGTVATSSSSDWSRVPSVFTLAKVVGLGEAAALAIHAAVALAATGAVAWTWRANAKPLVRAGALAAGVLLVTPYARIYDFALLFFPVVALFEEARARARSGDHLLLAAAWWSPLVGLLVKASTPWLSLLLVALLARFVAGAARERTSARRSTGRAENFS